MNLDNAAVSSGRVRRPLFRKYFIVLFTAVVVPLLASGVSDAWFGYSDQRANLSLRLGAEARVAAARIQGFLDQIRSQLEGTVQLPWAEGSDERHRFDALRLMRQAPAIAGVILVDGNGVERLRISRTNPDVAMSGVDRSTDPAVISARASHIWFGPLTLHRGSEPFMTVAVAGARTNAGVTIAEINLKLIWEVISAIHVGKTGDAFVLDGSGRLVAHSDIGLMLGGENNASVASLRALQAAAHGDDVVSGEDAEHRAVLSAAAQIVGPDWTTFVEQPIAEAYGPIRAALWRTSYLLVAGAAFAGALAYLLARRMIEPIKLLETGAGLIGAGHFDHKIDIRTGDELEGLASRFNEMAGELALSQERSERIARLKRFLAPQVAELVEGAGREGLLDSRRAEVAVVFCDLRGFTTFSTRVEPNDVIGLLGEYYEALGAIIMQYEATLTCFMGDGLMLLLNAPLPCPDPATRAVSMALDMQATVQALIVRWRTRGYDIGFGIGVATGEAIVGRIGYEGRIDYTAIGSVVNLASRICSSARDGQVLIDRQTAAASGPTIGLEDVGARSMKGFSGPVPVFAAKRAADPEARRSLAALRDPLTVEPPKT
jgi:class 3 adenylate cyclase